MFLLTQGVEDEVMEKIVNIRPKAMDHLQELRRSQGTEGDIFLRMGVRSGGCSGLSYIMDLVKKVIGQGCHSNSLVAFFGCSFTPGINVLLCIPFVLDARDTPLATLAR